MLEAGSSTSEAEQFPATSAAHRNRRISELKRQVALGRYKVCSGELADKLLCALKRCDETAVEEA